MKKVRVAVIGSGISGMVCAHVLGKSHEVTVIEAEPRPGGHAHTASVQVDGERLAVDTGFLVYNEENYPGLVRLFSDLGVVTKPSDMSFSVSDAVTGLEYRGSSLSALFAQRRNIARPDFLRMLVEVARFHRVAGRLLEAPPPPGTTLATVLSAGRWSKGFIDWYLVPLGASIWSADPSTFLQMPAEPVIGFFRRHGMLSFGTAPQWRTVDGGATRYVEAVLAPVRAAGRLQLGSPVIQVVRHGDGVDVRCHGGQLQRFDHVVMATHSDQALAALADPSPVEKDVLGAIGYQPNRVVLHTDESLMPRCRRAWAAWNYHRSATPSDRVTMTYWLNKLQSLPTASPVLITLNREDDIDPLKVIGAYDYSHPVLDVEAVAAQQRHDEVSGHRHTSYCGAYWGSGFHEDGVQSALAVCANLNVRWS